MNRRRMAALSTAISAAFALCGCWKQQPINDDTSALERAPPKPPNCPKSTELANITLKDGSIADVRIVQFLNTKLYFPADMIPRSFVDKMRYNHGFIDKTELSKFLPDIHSVECPGVVHKLLEEYPNDDRLTPAITVDVEYNIYGKIIKNIEPTSSVKIVSVTSNVKPRGYTLKQFIGVVTWYSTIEPMNDVLFLLGRQKGDYFNPSEGYRHYLAKSESIADFAKWLATPPAKRDNDKIFELKVDRYDSNK